MGLGSLGLVNMRVLGRMREIVVKDYPYMYIKQFINLDDQILERKKGNGFKIR